MSAKAKMNVCMLFVWMFFFFFFNCILLFKLMIGQLPQTDEKRQKLFMLLYYRKVYWWIKSCESFIKKRIYVKIKYVIILKEHILNNSYNCFLELIKCLYYLFWWASSNIILVIKITFIFYFILNLFFWLILKHPSYIHPLKW